MISYIYITVLSILMLNVLNVACVSVDNWPNLSPQIEIAQRSQRDVGKYLLIDQVTGMGISLNSLVFDKEGYTLDALNDVSTLLDVGVQTLMINLYWNEFTEKWQLCPAPFPANISSDITTTKELYWDDRTYKCEASLTVDLLVRTINTYFSETNTNIKVNMVQLLFHLKSIRIDPPGRNVSSSEIKNYISTFQPTDLHFVALNNATLNDIVSSFGTSLFTPSDLSSYRSTNYRKGDNVGFYNQTRQSFPTLNTFLLLDYKRVMTTVIANDLVKSQYTYNVTSSDKKSVFLEGSGVYTTVASLSDPDVVSQCNELIHYNQDNIEVFDNVSLKEHFRIVVDDNGTSFTSVTFSDFVRCGFSPILNASYYNVYNDEEDVSEIDDSLSGIVDNFIPLSFWSWAESQLIEPDRGLNISDSADSDNDEEEDDNDYDNDNYLSKRDLDYKSTHTAFKCVVMDENGWKVSDCYSRQPVACQKADSPNDWHIDVKNKREYFTAYKDDSCPDDYHFAIPLLSIEMLALMDYIELENISYPIWIDMNDITVPDCFVTGGPYATCPYQMTVTKLKLVGLIAPSFIVAVVILALILCEKIFRTNPIQSNRKRHWKKTINEYVEKYDYEGVPS